MLKSVLSISSLGRQLWDTLRAKSLGDLVQLPTKITKENITAVTRVRLNPEKLNTDCTVIYVVARKKIQ